MQRNTSLIIYRLATEFLMKGGTFVTKVFRSKDYQSLMWVFNQFFREVNSTKPAASRTESAEIFVVCLGYKAPDKIDPKFLEARHVFSEVEKDEKAEDVELQNSEKKRRKAPAEGYESGATVLFKKALASDFIMGDKPIHVLNNCHEIALDEPRIYNHPKTTKEVVECCKDVKVLGMKELRLLKKWRDTLRKEFEMESKKAEEKKKKLKEEDEEETVEGDEDESDDDLKKLDSQIEELREEEHRLARRKKKRAAKENRKILEKINLKMIVPGDVGSVREEEGLFRMKQLKSTKDVNNIAEEEPERLAESDDEEKDKKPKTKLVSREKGKLDQLGLYYKESESESDESDDDENDHVGDLGFEVDGHPDDEDEDGDGQGEEEMMELEKVDPPENNPLLLDLDYSSADTKRQRRVSMWFDKDVFKGIEDDEELADQDVANAIKELKAKNIDVKTRGRDARTKRKRRHSEDSDSSSSSEDEEHEAGNDSSSNFDVEATYSSMKKQSTKPEPDEPEVVPKKKSKKVTLTPEELALGQEMIMSKKRKRDIMDAGWNRFMFNESDRDLPDWFVQEERFHMRPHIELDQRVVQGYKERQKDLNVKTIKKVVEAKARKKRRLAKRMDKARKKAAALLDNPDIGSREKVGEIQRLYKKAAADVDKKEVKYVVAKKATTTGKRARRPAGVKGPYKQVDPRMKKDNQKKRDNATGKRLQKRRLKGKKARPTKR